MVNFFEIINFFTLKIFKNFKIHPKIHPNSFSVKNPREKLRDILNHANSKGVKTALNKVGEDYLVFNTDEGNYSVKEVKFNK